MAALPVVVWAGIALVVVGCASLFFLATDGRRTLIRSVQGNLQRGLGPTVAAGAARSGRRATRSLVPAVLRGPLLGGPLERLVTKAGRPAGWPVERVLATMLLLGLAGVVLGGLVVFSAGTPQSLALAAFIVVFLFSLPPLLLWNTGIKRRDAAQLEVPDTLDQMSIAVQAGLGFDAALVRVARNGRGVLAAELVRTLQDIQVGQSRRVAFASLAARLDVPELRRFLRATVQAEEYGLPLGDVLHAQAKEMRIARRQRAERKAMEIPVKVVFPLVLFLLPALMIVILGPAAMLIIAAFSR